MSVPARIKPIRSFDFVEYGVFRIFGVDDIVIPDSSPWFQFFAEGQAKTVVPLKQSQAYLEDWLGVRTLDRQGSYSWYKPIVIIKIFHAMLAKLVCHDSIVCAAVACGSITMCVCMCVCCCSYIHTIVRC